MLKQFRSLIRSPSPGVEAWQSALNDLLAKVNSQGARGIADFERLSSDDKLTPYFKAWLAFQRAMLLAEHGDRAEAVGAIHQAVHHESAGGSRTLWLAYAAQRMASLGRSDLAISYSQEVIHSEKVTDDLVQAALRVLSMCIAATFDSATGSSRSAAVAGAIRTWNEIISKTSIPDVLQFCRTELLLVHLGSNDLGSTVETADALSCTGAKSFPAWLWTPLLDLAISRRTDQPNEASQAVRVFMRYGKSNSSDRRLLLGPFLCLAAECFRLQSRTCPAMVAFQLAQHVLPNTPHYNGSGSSTAGAPVSVRDRFVSDVLSRAELRGLGGYPASPDVGIVAALVAPPSIRGEIVAACDALLDYSLTHADADPPSYLLKTLDMLDPFEHPEECSWASNYVVACPIQSDNIAFIQTMRWKEVMSLEIYSSRCDLPILPASIERRLSDACRYAYMDGNVRKASELFLELAADVTEELETEDRIRGLCWIAMGAKRAGCVATGERIVTGAMRAAEVFSAHPVERLRLLGIACRFLKWNGGCDDFPQLCLSVARDGYAQCISLKASAPGYSDRDRGDLFAIGWDFKIVLMTFGYA